MKQIKSLGVYLVFSCFLGGLAVQADETVNDQGADGAALTFSERNGGSGLFATQFGTPSAITAPKGTVYAAAIYVTPRAGIAGNGGDGDLSFGVAAGNPVSGIGLNFGLDITGIDPLADAGSLSITASRLLVAGERSVTFGALSGSGLAGWGVQSGQERFSGLITQWRSLNFGAQEVPFMWTIGYGQDAKYVGNGNTNKTDGVFWGAGIGVTDFLSFSLSGTDNQLNTGVGLRIPGVDGLGVTVGVYDVTDEHNRQQTSISVSYSTNFLKGR